MTPQERKFVDDLVFDPPSDKSKSLKEEFLRWLPSSVQNGKVALALLDAAFETKNSEDLARALTIGFAFSFGPEHSKLLCLLIGADWHYSHEDVVSALDELRSPSVGTALFHATQWIPEYLNFDESRALAVKAIWALGKLPGPEAENSLQALALSDNPILKQNALNQLERRAAIPNI